MRIVLFDFDGVISDSWKVAFSVAGEYCPGITEAEYQAAFEGNINDWVRPAYCKADFDYLAHYRPRIVPESHLFSGMDAVIRDLAARYTLTIVTSSIEVPVMELCKKFDVDSCFADILGNETHTSKVEKIRMVMDRYSLGPERCVFVTDTLGDAREAEHAGIGVIGVSWGFHDHATLSKDRAITIVDKPEDLPQAVDEHFAPM